MHIRNTILLLAALAIAALATLNWGALSTPSEVSLGLTTVQAPLGLLMLGLTVVLAVIFLAYVLSLQGSVLMETRRHGKEMQAQRELADKAEASRFTELRAFLEQQHAQGRDAVLQRIDALETAVMERARESDNSVAAYVGQLEQQVRSRNDQMLPVERL